MWMLLFALFGLVIASICPNIWTVITRPISTYIDRTQGYLNARPEFQQVSTYIAPLYTPLSANVITPARNYVARGTETVFIAIMDLAGPYIDLILGRFDLYHVLDTALARFDCHCHSNCK
jgi:hypothetical protein